MEGEEVKWKERRKEGTKKTINKKEKLISKTLHHYISTPTHHTSITHITHTHHTHTHTAHHTHLNPIQKPLYS